MNKSIKKFSVLLIIILLLTLSSCQQEKEKLSLFPGMYFVDQVIYHDPTISYVPPLERVVINEDFTFYEDSGLEIQGKLVEFTLTKDNFDDYFLKDENNFGWAEHENLTQTLRKENNRAWFVETSTNSTIYFLLQNNGRKYVVHVAGKNTESIRNLYRLQ